MKHIRNYIRESVESKLDELKDALSEISDERDLKVYLSEDWLTIRVIIDDLVDLSSTNIYNEKTITELKKSNDTIIDILKSVEASLNRCDIYFRALNFRIDNTQIDSDGDSHDIPLTLYIQSFIKIN